VFHFTFIFEHTAWGIWQIWSWLPGTHHSQNKACAWNKLLVVYFSKTGPFIKSFVVTHSYNPGTTSVWKPLCLDYKFQKQHVSQTNSIAFAFHTFHPHSSLFVFTGSAKNKNKKINVKYKTAFFLDNLRGLRAFLFAAVTKKFNVINNTRHIFSNF